MTEQDERVKKRKRIEAEWRSASWKTRKKWIEELERWMGEYKAEKVIEELDLILQSLCIDFDLDGH